MVELVEFSPEDRASVAVFVHALQEHERKQVPELRPGNEIAADYLDTLIRTSAERDGVILLAKAGRETVGFTCAWVDSDDDMLLAETARRHGYVSDIFIAAPWRRRRVAQLLLTDIERRMRSRGCHRMRIDCKATNVMALSFYESIGYRPYEISFTKRID